ncbi:hypothetical protein ECNE1487_1823, partial [Escherichia coli NE1487]
RQSHSSGCQR